MSIEPDGDIIAVFLDCLSLDLDGLGFYEVRMLHPDPIPRDVHTRARSRWFPTTLDGLAAATDFAVTWNRRGFNAYVTPNPLLADRPCNGKHGATDADVACWVLHLLDADDDCDVTGLLLNLREFEFSWAFRVITGTEPSSRMHIYFRLNDWGFDLDAGRTLQQRLAIEFGTDPSVCNPARVMRIAGSISYPSMRKRARGYVTEMTKLELGCGRSVPRQAFYDAFPAPVTPPQRPVDYSAADGGAIPGAVFAASLDAIPPVTCRGDRDRKLWLRVAYACKDAGQRALFEAWQRRSPLWRPEDAHVWATLHDVSPGSHVALFALAKQGNPDWWRTDAEAEDWFIEGVRQRSRINTTALDRWNNRLDRRLSHTTPRGQ